MDPRTLETIGGETDFGGQIGSRLAAHYRITSQPDGSKHWVTFTADVSG